MPVHSQHSAGAWEHHLHHALHPEKAQLSVLLGASGRLARPARPLFLYLQTSGFIGLWYTESNHQWAGMPPPNEDLWASKLQLGPATEPDP
jgi:hypothetical protein